MPPIKPPPSSADFNQLERVLSSPRLVFFLNRAGYDQNRALKLYVWDSRLSLEFIFLIRLMEVALQNGVDSAFTKIFSSRYWFEEIPFQKLLSRNYAQKFHIFYAEYQNIKDRVRDDFISRMQLPQISMLFSEMFDDKVWKLELASVFKNAPPEVKREEIFQLLNDLRDIWTHIARHEPLLGKNYTKYSGDIFRILGWLNPQIARLAAQNSELGVLLRSHP
jgi:hypothetical protein